MGASHGGKGIQEGKHSLAQQRYKCEILLKHAETKIDQILNPIQSAFFGSDIANLMLEVPATHFISPNGSVQRDFPDQLAPAGIGLLARPSKNLPIQG